MKSTQTLARYSLAIFAAALVASGCGGAPPEAPKDAAKTEKTDTATKPADQTPQQAAQSMAQGLEQMAKGMQAVQTGPDGKPLQVVDFEKLQDALPAPGGWERGKIDGRQSSSPFVVSTVEVAYTKGDARVKVTITDAALNQMLLGPMTMALAFANERSTNGFKRLATYAGQPGHEEWDSESKHAEVLVIVNKRIIVQVDGSSMTAFDQVKEVAGQIDVAKLAALK